MVSVCSFCSGINLVELQEKVGKDNVQVGCIGECGGRDGLVIGYANGDFIEAETTEEFIEQV